MTALVAALALAAPVPPPATLPDLSGAWHCRWLGCDYLMELAADGTYLCRSGESSWRGTWRASGRRVLIRERYGDDWPGRWAEFEYTLTPSLRSHDGRFHLLRRLR